MSECAIFYSLRTSGFKTEASVIEKTHEVWRKGVSKFK